VCCSAFGCVAVRLGVLLYVEHIMYTRQNTLLYCVGVLRCAYGVLKCVAVCCSVLQCVAVCCSVLQCVEMCCSVLQSVAGKPIVSAHFTACCSVSKFHGVLQCVAVCCSVFQSVADKPIVPAHFTVRYSVFQNVAVFCGVLQCVAVCCSMLRDFSVFCGALQ